MTRKLFWEDMYISSFEGKVLSIDGNKVVIDQTAFNPRGGGLVSDTGSMEGVRVQEVLKDGEEIFHILEQPPSFKVGDSVHGILDWERRYRIMKMHTAAHMLSAIVNRETGALITGNQISPDESRVDFSVEQFDREKFNHYVDLANEVVRRGVDVTTSFMKREEALRIPGLVKLANAMPPSLDILRIVRIGDVDTQADGGVHVRNTKEIRNVVGNRVENKGKSNRRIYYTVS
jgi:misacylated tRNA(Ala) deacylase